MPRSKPAACPLSPLTLQKPYVALGGIDVSDHVKTVTINHDAASGATEGFQSWTAEIDFIKNGSGDLNELLIVLIGTQRHMLIRPSGKTRGYQGSGLFTSYRPHSDRAGAEEKSRLSVNGEKLVGTTDHNRSNQA